MGVKIMQVGDRVYALTSRGPIFEIELVEKVVSRYGYSTRNRQEPKVENS